MKKQRARQRLEKMAAVRKKQADKHGWTLPYQEGDLIWTKTHRLSDKSRNKMRKLYILYEGPYRIRMAIRPNAYVVETLRGFTKGVYNARQIRPHREAKWSLKYGQNDGEQNSNKDLSGESESRKQQRRRTRSTDTQSSFRTDSSVDTDTIATLTFTRKNMCQRSKEKRIRYLLAKKERLIMRIIKKEEKLAKLINKIEKSENKQGQNRSPQDISGNETDLIDSMPEEEVQPLIRSQEHIELKNYI